MSPKVPSATCKFAIEQFSRFKKIGKVQQISDFPEKYPVLYHNPGITLFNFLLFKHNWNNLQAVAAIGILTYLTYSRNQAWIDRIVDIRVHASAARKPTHQGGWVGPYIWILKIPPPSFFKCFLLE